MNCERYKIVGVGRVGCSALNALHSESTGKFSLIAVNHDLYPAPRGRSSQILSLGIGQSDLLSCLKDELESALVTILMVDLNDDLPAYILLSLAALAQEQSSFSVVIAIDEREGDIAEGLAPYLHQKVDSCILLTWDCLGDFERKTSEVRLFEGPKQYVMAQLVQALTYPIIEDGVYGIDVVDVKHVLTGRGMAVVGVGVAAGEGRAGNALRQAFNSPQLQAFDANRPAGALAYLTASSDQILEDVEEVETILDTLDGTEYLTDFYNNEELYKVFIATLIVPGLLGDRLLCMDNLFPNANKALRRKK